MKRAGILLGLVLAGCAPKPAPAGGGTAPRPIAMASAAPTATPAPITLPPMHEETLANELEVLILEHHELPVVSMTVLWKNGAVLDPRDKAGLTELTAVLLRQGTKTRSAEQIAEAIDFLGGAIEGSADADSAQVGVQVLEKDFAAGLELLADVAQHPSFPKSEVEDLKLQHIAGARQVFDDPSELGRQHVRALVLGEDHPYAAFPTERSIASITRADVEKHFATWFGPDQAIVAIAGDVDTSAAMAAVQKAFASWPKKRPASPIAFPDPPQAKRALRLVDKDDLTQSSIRIGMPGIERKSPDYHAAILMNYVLGGGAFSSRLIKTVRSDEGKTYGISSAFTIQKRRALFGISTSTRNAETVATLDLVLREVEKMKKDGVTAAELASAKSNLIGRYPERFETADDVVENVLAAKLLGLPMEELTQYRSKVAAVTKEEVDAAAARYLVPDRAVIVVVGKASDVKAPLEAKYGPAEVVDFLTLPRTVDRVAKPKATH